MYIYIYIYRERERYCLHWLLTFYIDSNSVWLLIYLTCIYMWLLMCLLRQAPGSRRPSRWGRPRSRGASRCCPQPRHFEYSSMNFWIVVSISEFLYSSIYLFIYLSIHLFAPLSQTWKRGGEGTADRDTAASNRSTCLELLDREPFLTFQQEDKLKKLDLRNLSSKS